MHTVFPLSRLAHWRRLGILLACLPLAACSFAPVVAQKLGVGVASDQQVTDATAKHFGVPASQVRVSELSRDNSLNGTIIYYNAQVGSKRFRCVIASSFASDSLPKCAKPGEPLPSAF